MAGQIIYFREEIHKKLKEQSNMSKLINDLLEDYFKKTESPKKEDLIGLKIEKEKIAKEALKEANKIETKITETETKEKEIKKILKNIPEKILEDFKEFPEMTEEGLHTRFREIYGNNKITWNELLEAWRKYHEF